MINIYLRAAERIIESEEDNAVHKFHYCCTAIRKQSQEYKYISLFEEYFKPTRANGHEAWWLKIYDNGKLKYKDQQARILALLFMHEIINDKDQS